MTHRRRQDPIIDLETDLRDHVCLRVAAEYLNLDERTVKARIDNGDLDADVDGKVYRVPMLSLKAYERRRRAS